VSVTREARNLLSFLHFYVNSTQSHANFDVINPFNLLTIGPSSFIVVFTAREKLGSI